MDNENENTDVKEFNKKLSSVISRRKELLEDFDMFIHRKWMDYVEWPFKVAFLYPWQRAVRGYDDRALWSLDDYLTDHIEKMLLMYWVHERSGHPADRDEKTWNRQLMDLHRSWEALKLLKHNEHTLFSIEEADKETEFYENTKRKAFDLLYEHFERLWD